MTTTTFEFKPGQRVKAVVREAFDAMPQRHGDAPSCPHAPSQ